VIGPMLDAWLGVACGIVAVLFWRTRARVAALEDGLVLALTEWAYASQFKPDGLPSKQSDPKRIAAAWDLLSSRATNGHRRGPLDSAKTAADVLKHIAAIEGQPWPY